MKRLEATLRVRGGPITVQESRLDQAIRVVSPKLGMSRFQSRVQAELATRVFNRYGSRKTSKSSDKWAQQWNVVSGDADADSLDDLPDMRADARDLVHKNPLACAAVQTKTCYTVGTGLTLNARVDQDVLGLSDAQAENLNRSIERYWALWSEHADIRDKQHFRELQATAFASRVTNGDMCIVRRFRRISGSPFGLRLQLVEADRLANPFGVPDSVELAGGIERTRDGRPIAYHFRNAHPGSDLDFDTDSIRVPARGRSGLRQVIHYHRVGRIGETRGIPEIASVVDMLKQLGRYTDAELMAAVVSAMFTVFIKSPGGGVNLTPMAETGSSSDVETEDIAMGNGAVVGLAAGEDVAFANPGRPNSNADVFVTLMLRHIAPAMQLPVEILIKHFTSSYSASRAAFEDLWKAVRIERFALETQICRTVQKWLMWEMVAAGMIAAPGFFSDPLIRKAYLGGEWIGPAKGSIDETKDAAAAEKWIELGVKSHSRVVQEVTGEDPDSVARQIARERRATPLPPESTE